MVNRTALKLLTFFSMSPIIVLKKNKLTPMEGLLLSFYNEAPRIRSDAYFDLWVPRPTITRVCKSLVEKGLIIDKPMLPKSCSKGIVELTEAGKSIAKLL